MENWLKSLRWLLMNQNWRSAEVTVVLGNEACDLDSGVSAISLAYHLHCTGGGSPVFPVLNIHSKDYDLKTELVHCLHKLNIREDDLVFRDSIDLNSLEKLRLVLVDHNLLSTEDSGLEKHVVEVVDHHVLERDQEDPQKKVCVFPVGSCSTLVAEKIFSENPAFADSPVLDLILQAIILDTVALDPKAKKVTGRDVEMVERIEAVLGRPVDRQAVFDEVWAAKGRFQHLTPYQLLRRDLKFVCSGKVKVGLSSVPLLAKDFLQLKDVERDLSTFVSEEKLGAEIVLGFTLKEGEVQRDIFIFSPVDPDLLASLTSGLNSPDLALQLNSQSGIAEFGKFFQQGNAAASRKQILPAVKFVLNKL